MQSHRSWPFGAVAALTLMLYFLPYANCGDIHSNLQTSIEPKTGSSYFIQVSGSPEAWKYNQKVLFDAYASGDKDQKTCLKPMEFHEPVNSLSDGVQTVGTIRGNIGDLLIVPSQCAQAAFDVQFCGRSDFSLVSYRNPVAIPFSGVSDFSAKAPIYYKPEGGFSVGPVATHAATDVCQGQVQLTRQTCFPRLIGKVASNKAEDAIPALKNKVATETTRKIADRVSGLINVKYHEASYAFANISFTSTDNLWTLQGLNEPNSSSHTLIPRQPMQTQSEILDIATSLQLTLGNDTIDELNNLLAALGKPLTYATLSRIRDSLIEALHAETDCWYVFKESICVSTLSQNVELKLDKSSIFSFALEEDALSLSIPFDTISVKKSTQSLDKGILRIRYSRRKDSRNAFSKPAITIINENSQVLKEFFAKLINEWLNDAFCVSDTSLPLKDSIRPIGLEFSFPQVVAERAIIQFQLMPPKSATGPGSKHTP